MVIQTIWTNSTEGSLGACVISRLTESSNRLTTIKETSKREVKYEPEIHSRLSWLHYCETTLHLMQWLQRSLCFTCMTTSFEISNSLNCFPSAGIQMNQCNILDRCSPNPCEHGGECRQTWDQFTCNCKDGYGGAVCHTSIHHPSCEEYKLVCRRVDNRSSSCKNDVGNRFCNRIKKKFSKNLSLSRLNLTDAA